MQPVFFDGCSGWLHRPWPEAPRRRLGVVFCSAVGRDERCTHKPLRLFADQLAAAGYASLRYDPPGLGDAVDLAPDADVLGSWVSAVGAAKALLRQAAGVERLALVGARFGGALAALGAEEDDLLVLLAPVLQGRSWLAKLQFAARQGTSTAAATPLGEGPFDADGLMFSKETVLSLLSVDLQTLEGAPREVVVAANGRLTDPFEGRLRSLGSEVRRLDFPGYEELFLDPNSNVPPGALFDALEELFGGVDAALAVRGRPEPAAFAPALEPPAEPVLELDGATEHPVCFGQALRGVVAKPASGARGGLGVIFLNTGGDPRAGIGRFAVTASRKLAAAGTTALRFDFAGIGDSPAPADHPAVHVYETPRRGDLDAALALMAEEGVERVVVVGVSAGAYHAVGAVIGDDRIAGAFAVSPLKLVWRPGDSLAIGTRHWGRATRAYVKVAGRPETWMRFLRGEVGLRPVARTLSSRLLARLARRKVSPESHALRTAIAGVSQRGGRICLLMGVDDASIDEIESHFGRGGRAFTRLRGMSLKIVSGLDHGLVYGFSRQAAETALFEWLAAG